MNQTKRLLALLLAAYIGPAVAVAPGYLGNLSGQTFGVSNSFAAGVTFSDEYIFDIASASAAVGTAVTIDLDIPQFAGQEFAIQNFSVAFLDNQNQTITSDIQTTSTDYTVSISANLTADTGYKFIVSGNVIGTLGGSYGGVLQAISTVAAPVPEADTYAFMALGLGLVSLLARRRKA